MMIRKGSPRTCYLMRALFVAARFSFCCILFDCNRPYAFGCFGQPGAARPFRVAQGWPGLPGFGSPSDKQRLVHTGVHELVQVWAVVVQGEARGGIGARAIKFESLGFLLKFLCFACFNSHGFMWAFGACGALECVTAWKGTSSFSLVYGRSCVRTGAGVQGRLHDELRVGVFA